MNGIYILTLKSFIRGSDGKSVALTYEGRGIRAIVHRGIGGISGIEVETIGDASGAHALGVRARALRAIDRLMQRPPPVDAREQAEQTLALVFAIGGVADPVRAG